MFTLFRIPEFGRFRWPSVCLLSFFGYRLLRLSVRSGRWVRSICCFKDCLPWSGFRYSPRERVRSVAFFGVSVSGPFFAFLSAAVSVWISVSVFIGRCATFWIDFSGLGSGVHLGSRFGRLLLSGLAFPVQFFVFPSVGSVRISAFSPGAGSVRLLLFELAFFLVRFSVFSSVGVGFRNFAIVAIQSLNCLHSVGLFRGSVSSVAEWSAAAFGSVWWICAVVLPYSSNDGSCLQSVAVRKGPRYSR